MAHKARLRKNRDGTIINIKSKKEDEDIYLCVMQILDYIKDKYPALSIEYSKHLSLKDIIAYVKLTAGIDDMSCELDGSHIKPDGGIISINVDGVLHPILIGERKNQGTNDIRLIEGKGKQSRGNAVERLGKNVIGLQTYMIAHDIFPFVCFGDGCDFEEGSSIRDRVVTINQFGKLNKIYVKKENGLSRGSFFFRLEHWGVEEMFDIMKEIVDQSISYYKEKGIIS